MDLAASCRDKLTHFRIKELKDVLTQLGLPKQGKKQDLVDKILSLLSDGQASKSHAWAKKNSVGKDGVAKIIEDTYRKMQLPGASDLASKSQSSSDINQVKPKEEVNDSYLMDMKVRCPCGSSLITDSMIQCEDSRCHVWQHIDCVIIPEKPMEGVLPDLPPCFYCETCRLNRADPFWLTVAHPLLPVKLPSSGVTSDGFGVFFSMIKSPFRMQWPQHPELHVNGFPVRTTNRPGSQLLGINGRDDGPLITTCSKEGINKICLTRCDTRIFSFGIRIAKRRTVQQVLNMVPKEEVGEQFEDAIARVCRCIGGGNAAENADSDSDVEVVADSVTVNLRCPMSGSRIKIAGRFKPCVHMGCFDLETFVELNQRSRKWQCPICLKNYSLENVIIDPYFNRITTLMKACGEDVNEIDVKPDGSWRAKGEGECRDLARWHLPDGSLCTAMDGEVSRGLESYKQIKQEDVYDDQAGLRSGTGKKTNGFWELNKGDDTNTGNHLQHLIPMSSSATGSYKDGEDPSVNQDGGGNFDFSLNNADSLNCDPTYEVEERIPPGASKDANVIVLSDSDDEDNVTLISSKTDGTTIPFPSSHPGFGDIASFTNDSDEFEMPLWQMPTYSQPSSTFQLFGPDGNGSNSLVDAHENLLPPLTRYGLAENDGVEEASQDQDLSTFPPNTEENGSLVDNPLAYGNNDPSLQIFLPSQPAVVPPQADLDKQTDMNNGVGFGNWISLSVGGAEGGDVNSTSINGANSKQQLSARENDTASLLLSMNGGGKRPATKNGRKSDGPFSHPRQPRSVRPRYLSIDTDSD